MSYQFKIWQKKKERQYTVASIQVPFINSLGKSKIFISDEEYVQSLQIFSI